MPALPASNGEWKRQFPRSAKSKTLLLQGAPTPVLQPRAATHQAQRAGETRNKARERGAFHECKKKKRDGGRFFFSKPPPSN